MTRPDLSRGACVGHDNPDLWFTDTAAARDAARRICGTCVVQRECGTNAILTREFAGIRAGLDGTTLGQIAARAARPAAVTLTDPTPRPTCGRPYSGPRAHRRNGEHACEPCRTATTDARRDARHRASDAA